MYKKILTVKHGKHKGLTFYATDKTFRILYGIIGALVLGLFFGAVLIMTAMSPGAI